jgi:hypothetical protein
MAIATGTAILGAAVHGGAASMYGASKASKAASSAQQSQEEAARRQEQLSREIYYDQRGLQQPYYQAGLQGLYGPSGVMNLLGMSQPAQGPQAAQGVQQTTQPQPVGRPQLVNVGGGAMMQGGDGQMMAQAGGNAFSPYASVGEMGQPMIPQGGPNWQAYLQSNPDVAAYYRNNPQALQMFGGDLNRAAEYHYNTFGRSEGRELPQYQPQAQMQAPATEASNAFVPQGEPGEGSMTATLRQTPGYQFLQDESRKALEGSFAARGNLLSGGAMKALQQRGMGIADQTYQQAINNAFNLTNIGMGSAAQIQGAGNQYGNMAGNAFANAGNAAATGAMNRAGAWNAGAQGVYNSAMGGLGAYGAYGNFGQSGGSSPSGFLSHTAPTYMGGVSGGGNAPPR